MKNQRVYTRAQAAEYLGVSKRILDHWAWNKSQDIPYLKIGKLVRYLKEDLDKWLESKRVINVQQGVDQNDEKLS